MSTNEQTHIEVDVILTMIQFKFQNKTKQNKWLNKYRNPPKSWPVCSINCTWSTMSAYLSGKWTSSKYNGLDTNISDQVTWLRPYLLIWIIHFLYIQLI